MNVFQKLWRNWAKFPYGKPDPEEMTWLNELNQAVFSRLEKKLPEHIQMRVVDVPSFAYQPTEGVLVSAHVESRRMIVPEGPFEKRVELATELLLELIDTPGTRTVFFYWPLYPMGNELHDGTPNRRHLCTRLRTTPDVVVDAGGTPDERNT